jgi:hypothetical protein
MKRLLFAVMTLGLLVGILPRYFVSAAGPCTLCIVEVGTIGLNGEEDQDFVIMANTSPSRISASGIQLRYFTDKGLQANSFGIGTFEAGQTKVYSSKSIADVNAGVTNTFNFGLFSGGGSLQIARTTGTSTSVYDSVGWGSAVVGEGVPAPALFAGGTLARKQIAGMPQDTDNNNTDFESVEADCRGIGIVEVQPFVADADGQAIDAWLEVNGGSDKPGDCLLVTKSGDSYHVPAADLPLTGETKVLNRGINAQGEIVPFRLGEVGGQVWLDAESVYPDANDSPIRLPLTNVSYGNLANGQSWALIDAIWRRTYSPTPGSPNLYQSDAGLSDDEADACEPVRISELLPNPAGEDTGHEWVEIVNESEQPVSLRQCQITIAGETYRFLPDDILGPHEWRANYELFDANESPRTITLRNSGSVSVLLQRLHGDGTTDTVQSFLYEDASEGQSWARFTMGWRWEALPTPGLDNTTPPSPGASDEPTEFPELPKTEGSENVSGIQITELLPNPASPDTDDNDEFVELFNGSDQLVHLGGYKLQTGNSYSYSYTLTNQTIPPKGYLVVTSGDSSLSLANSGGRARLLSPVEEVVHETVPYLDALEGNAWAFINNVWQWTATPTPGADNRSSTPVLGGISKAKAASTKKASTAVKSAAKTSAPKSPKTSAAATKPSGNGTEQAAAISPVHSVVLAVVGGLAVLYAAYEYRQDIANRIYQFRRNRGRR